MASPSHSPQQNDIDEAMIDKFATLFSPATPRASPTLEPVALPAKPRRPRSFHQDASGSDSEFGAFVSVSAMDDPLASLDVDSQQLPPAISPSRSTTTDHPGHSRGSASLNFFDKFAQDAKQAAERNKHDVLDELLMHEDDPLYWLGKEHPSGRSDASANRGSSSEPASPPSMAATDTSSTSPLHDLDQDFFITKPASSTLNQPRAGAAATARPDHSPTRSSTLALPVTPAPPVATTSHVSPSSSTDSPLALPGSSPPTRPRPRPRPPMHPSASYSTLSSLSSRWMSSLLPSSSNKPSSSSGSSSNHHHPGAPSLDSLFPSSASASSAAATHHFTTLRASSLPSKSQAAHAHAHISHTTPFAPSWKPSPFASHVYVPPSGAPGYAGERYDWDKGYSAELEREMMNGRGEGHEEGEGEGRGLGRGRCGEKEMEKETEQEKAKEKEHDVRKVIERRSGGVELLGRKASTAPVLDAKLADTIRPHLPALARLPRTWTLLYSLDQHGISLNTLYTRCEAATQRPQPAAGALVVVKDAGDAVFGVWTGREGVRPSRGRGYYGSGESFLWKQVPGSARQTGPMVQVFKWTGKNDYVALCEPEYISFGGGDGNYGLYLDDTLYSGSSAACPTFGNEPLCSGAPGARSAAVKFECVGLEVWGVGP
ncbi:putative TLD-domain-containing protein [Lyophyllum shimeji]|uniref:Oxidation resistance protein 1 n=1 Tax=Lyophyllum shimeji TaxID=47721 RepID=A0A9P3Q206_LYOSH|nr:putative TLD-domain-containing protein [Lyophyllum shimeji]